MNCIDTNNTPLDPTDWEAFRSLGHRAVDDLCAHLASVAQGPVWAPVPPEIEAMFRQPLPELGYGMEHVYNEAIKHVLPYGTGNIHPRFWGWVMGTGLPFGVVADLIASAMNSNAMGNNDVTRRVETQVLDWCKTMMGYPVEASGLLVTGASMANIIGLAVARHAHADFAVRQQGLRAAPRPLTLYTSQEGHSCLTKAIELLGFGSDALRRVPVDSAFRIDLDALRTLVTRDRANGDAPICVIGNAGTVNTGACDDLRALHAFCQQENLWFHVDGAFGALAAVSPLLRDRVAGLELADSLAFDLHKWMSLPYDVACILVRDRDQHRATFASPASYLARLPAGLSAGDEAPGDYGPQLSRSFRALRVWMCLAAHGLATFRTSIERNVAQAAYLASWVAASPYLELLAPTSLNIVCFRYVPTMSIDANVINERIVIALQESGVAVTSHTKLAGRFAIRVAITNHRSREEDFDLLGREVVRLGRALENEEAS